MPSLLLSTWNTRELRPGSGRFRSDVPVHLLPGEVRWLRDVRGVSLAIDLRSETEQAAKPCALKSIPGITYESRPVVTGDITPHCPEDVPRSYLSMTGGDLRGRWSAFGPIPAVSSGSATRGRTAPAWYRLSFSGGWGPAWTRSRRTMPARRTISGSCWRSSWPGGPTCPWMWSLQGNGTSGSFSAAPPPICNFPAIFQKKDAKKPRLSRFSGTSGVFSSAQGQRVSMGSTRAPFSSSSRWRWQSWALSEGMEPPARPMVCPALTWAPGLTSALEARPQ